MQLQSTWKTHSATYNFLTGIERKLLTTISAINPENKRLDNFRWMTTMTS